MSILRILLPAIAFQSVIVAGGYSSGQELNEFFLKFGPTAGLIGILLTAISWMIVAFMTYEYARKFELYDYRSFFKKLLGPLWILFELSYLYCVIVVVSIVFATFSHLLQQYLGSNQTLITAIAVCYMMYVIMHGGAALEKMFSFWSLFLFSGFLVFFVFTMYHFGDRLPSIFVNSPPVTSGLFISSLTYSGYNIGLMPAVFFALKSLSSTKETFWAALLTGGLSTIPACMLYLCLTTHYPDILSVTVPSVKILDTVNNQFVYFMFLAPLFGTLLETVSGLIHSVNVRLKSHLAEYKLEFSTRFKFMTTSFLILGSYCLSKVGLMELISTGYRALTYMMIFIYIGPLVLYWLGQILQGPKSVSTKVVLD